MRTLNEMNENHRVILVQKDRYLVRGADEELYCVLAGSLRYQDEFPVVGDYVEVIANPYGDSLIRAIQPRKTVFCRPDRGGHADGFVKTVKVQPLVANIDYVFIITSLNGDFSVSRIARYAAMAASGGAIPVAVLTKADACDCVEEMQAQAAALSERIQVVSVSAHTGFGMDKLGTYFKPGATIALLGSSGAGKSTLINTLVGREVLRVGEIREKDSKGRHTTTQRQLIEIDGVSFIDTPGLRELGVIDAGEGIADTFSDIAELTGQCAFSNCTHRTEPGCAIRRALEDGSLSRERWEMYARLERENQWNMDKKNELMVSVAKHRRELNRTRNKR